LTEISPLDVEGLLAALEAAEVQFVVIGGFAVGAHGYPRATKDLDIVPDPAPENLQRLALLLSDLNASVLGMEEFTEEEEVVQPDMAGLAMGGNFVLATSRGRLDIMQLVGPDLEYADLDAASVEDEVFGHRVRFCGFDHLIAMKEAAGRPEDELDLQRLRESREASTEPPV
jgi:hypothetical protein